LKYLYGTIHKDFYNFIYKQNKETQNILYSGMIYFLFEAKRIKLNNKTKDTLFATKTFLNPNENINWRDAERYFNLRIGTYESLQENFNNYLENINFVFNSKDIFYIKFAHEQFFLTECNNCSNNFICRNSREIPIKGKLLNFEETKIITREEYENNI